MQATKRNMVLQARQLLANERLKMVKKEQQRLKAVAVQRNDHMHQSCLYTFIRLLTFVNHLGVSSAFATIRFPMFC